MSSTSPQMTGVDMVNPFFLCPKKERERKRNWYFGLKRPGRASGGAGAGADLDTLLGAWAVLTGGPGWGGRYACGRVTGNTGSPSMERTPRSALRKSLCMAAGLSLPPPGPYLQDRAARSQPPAGRRCALSTACHVPLGLSCRCHGDLPWVTEATCAVRAPALGADLSGDGDGGRWQWASHAAPPLWPPLKGQSCPYRPHCRGSACQRPCARRPRSPFLGGRWA